MTDTEPSFGRTWSYRFTSADGVIETKDFNGDDTAETWAHELSRTHNAVITVHRSEGGDDWKYITEADARP